MSQRKNDAITSSSGGSASKEGSRYPVSDDQLRTQVLDEYANACATVGSIVRRCNVVLRQLEPADRLEITAELAGVIRRFTKTGELALAVL